VDANACARCGSTEYFEPIKLERQFEKDGQTYYEYKLRCNKCGRIDPYITTDSSVIGPRQAFRMELEAEGLQKTAVAGTVNASSDQFGAPAPKESPLDEDWNARKAAGLV